MSAMDEVAGLLFRILQTLFIAGVLGCLLVIPKTAYELFKTFFEPDTPEEIQGNRAALQP